MHQQPTTRLSRPITHTSPDVHILRLLTLEEQRELRDLGVWLNPPLVRASSVREEDR